MSRSGDCARVIVDQLIGHGVREVVLAPGSRSAPLAYALHRAAQAGRVRLHVRIDERSAAFLALGLAKAGDQPVPVITTSGSAAANLHPAALEAWHSGVALIMITADRPGVMINTGANQTTVQQGMYAPLLRAEAQLDADLGRPAHWRHQVARVVAASTGLRTRSPGPVHLNVAFGEPLVDVDQLDDDQPDQTAAEASSATNPPIQHIQPMTIVDEPVRLATGPRTVIVVGDAPPRVGRRAAQLAERARLPLFAEPSGNARGSHQSIHGYRLLLTSQLADQIERVITFGHPTLSRPVQRLLGRSDIELIMVGESPEWIDPEVNASQIVSDVEVDPDDGRWLGRWREADDRLRRQIEELIGPAKAEPASGPRLADTVWRALGADDVLVVGSSNPVRDLDLAGPNADAPLVYANRGLAGIDGTVSTAVGIASSSGRPTHALIGDLTFLHDSNGLIIGPDEPRPDLRLVVANDDGGSIFTTLEYGTRERQSTFERLFGTPHGVDLAQLCAGMGITHHRVASAAAVAEHLTEPPDGLEVLEVEVDRRSRRELDQALIRLAEA